MITKTLSVRYGRFWLLCAIAVMFIFSLWSAPAVQAQCRDDRDCDGVTDTVDRCPDQAGPPDNGGCPVKDPDSDGDGLADSVDRCPRQPGPPDNGGCPKEEKPPEQPPAPSGETGAPPVDPAQADPPDPVVPPEEPALLLPYMPEDGPCVVATQGTDGVNVRALPDTSQAVFVLRTLDPELLYPAVMSFQTPEGTWWMLEQGGFVAEWVTRQGGDCMLLPAIQMAREVSVQKGTWVLDLSQPEPLPLLAKFDKTGAMTWSWYADLTEEHLNTNPGEESGFDPQPDPPGEAVGVDPQPDPPSDAGGVNPLPEPPSVIVLVNPGGNTPSDTGNPLGDEGGFIINWTLGNSSALDMCDGSIIPCIHPGDRALEEGIGIFFCDGLVKPTESMMGDISVMPTNDDSVMPSWLLPAMVFPGGGGEALGCTNNLLPGISGLGGPDTSPTPTCLFSNGDILATCQVGMEEALCAYSEF